MVGLNPFERCGYRSLSHAIAFALVLAFARSLVCVFCCHFALVCFICFIRFSLAINNMQLLCTFFRVFIVRKWLRPRIVSEWMRFLDDLDCYRCNRKVEIISIAIGIYYIYVYIYIGAGCVVLCDRIYLLSVVCSQLHCSLLFCVCECSVPFQFVHTMYDCIWCFRLNQTRQVSSFLFYPHPNGQWCTHIYQNVITYEKQTIRGHLDSTKRTQKGVDERER